MARAIDFALITYLHLVVGVGIYICYRAFHRLRKRISTLELNASVRPERFEDLVVSATQDLDTGRRAAAAAVGIAEPPAADREPTRAYSTPETEFLRRLERLRASKAKAAAR